MGKGWKSPIVGSPIRLNYGGTKRSRAIGKMARSSRFQRGFKAAIGRARTRISQRSYQTKFFRKAGMYR